MEHWYRFCVFHSFVQHSHIVVCIRLSPVKVYERNVQDRSKQRNESFFARLNVVFLFFRLFVCFFFPLINIP